MGWLIPLLGSNFSELNHFKSMKNFMSSTKTLKFNFWNDKMYVVGFVEFLQWKDIPGSSKGKRNNNSMLP